MAVEQQQMDAGQDILARRKKERDAHVDFPAFSRVVLEDAAGKQRVFWLVERVVGDLNVQRTWTGAPTGGVVTRTALDEGIVVSKNAVFGLLLDEYGEQLGNPVPLPTRLQENWGAEPPTVIGCTHYVPRGDDAIDGSMYVEAEGPLNFASLKAFVAELEELVASEPEVEIEAWRQARDRDIQAFRKAKRARIRHVITSAALRNQPKLDSQQLRVKQLQILDGQVIIEGGPGTGKTTALLDRISLLTDAATIREHVPGLSDAALGRLTDPATAYRLFTPNELLVHYLKEAMDAKGLLAGSGKLKTWSGYRDRLAHQMGLLTADPDRSRFVKDRRAFQTESTTFEVQAGEWQAFLAALRETFSEFVSWRHQRILNIEATASHDPGLVRRVQDRLAEAGRARSLPELMRIFQSLYAQQNARATEAHREGTDRLGRLATRLHASIRADKQLRRRLMAALAKLRSDQGDEDGSAQEAGGIESLAAGQQLSKDRAKEEVELIDRLTRSLLRKLALRRGLPGIRFTKLEQAMLDHVQERIDGKALESLTPTLLTGLVRSACAGPDRNVVDQVGLFYLWLRRTHFAGRLSAFLHRDLRDRVAESGAPKGKSIGPDELDLVLFLQLWLLRIRRATPALRRSATSRLSTVFEHSLREIIAVDEATDFSPIQLASMAMSANPEYDCVTLSGDLMQRMTAFGLRGWEEYEAVASAVGLAPVHRAGLQVSYRQSHRLLALSARLYQASAGSVAPTRSPYPPSTLDPRPLLHVDTALSGCADWIAQRIVEIRRSYDDHGVIPTIAVLVPDEPSVAKLARALEEVPSLGANIEIDPCRDGRVLGEGAYVRIFNVEHIKGLEFEAAFFHDMGAIAARFPELAEKLLYVGLSRASLYLGITAIGELPQVLDPLLDDLADGDWST